MDKSKRILCSRYSSENKEGISGTAPDWDTLILVSLNTPWQPDIEDSNDFPAGIIEIVKSASSATNKIRLQCIIPDEDYVSSGLTKIIKYSKQLDEGYFSKFQKCEFDVSSDKIDDLIKNLVVNEDEKLIEEGLVNKKDARDIFVCTHGSRDVCCASFGFPIYTKLKDKYSDTSTRIWRISHLGGHRYAPNVIEMPTGRVWARFGVDDIEGIFEKQYPAKEIEPFYRGLIGLNSGYEQIVEANLLFQNGWDWVDMLFKSKVVESENDRAIVQFETSKPKGTEKSLYQGSIEIDGYAQTIKCVTGVETKKEPQYKMVAFDKLA
tara:strand:- start:579 stop:1544 length:966 start_codon:yes stop_codon:yes gene_type:complete